MTQKEFLEEHRKELDKAFSLRYPSGRYTVQFWDSSQGKILGMHYVSRRLIEIDGP